MKCCYAKFWKKQKNSEETFGRLQKILKTWKNGGELRKTIKKFGKLELIKRINFGKFSEKLEKTECFPQFFQVSYWVFKNIP